MYNGIEKRKHKRTEKPFTLKLKTLPDESKENVSKAITMSNGSEKRKYKRIEKPFIVKLQTLPDEPKERVSPDWDMVVAKDLGAGGVFFHCSKNLGIGTALDLKIGFSTSTPPIKCVGEVVRIIKQPYTSIFGIAVAFTKIHAQQKEMINRTALEMSRQPTQNFAPAFA